MSSTSASSPKGAQTLRGRFAVTRRLAVTRFESKIAVLLVLVFVICAMSSAVAGATTLEKLSIEQLSQRADTVVVGTALAPKAEWRATANGRTIDTVVDVKVLDTLKGNAGKGRLLKVRTAGGMIGADRLEVPGYPKFEAGDTCVLFLDEKGRVIGGFQGKVDLQGAYSPDLATSLKSIKARVHRALGAPDASDPVKPKHVEPASSTSSGAQSNDIPTAVALPASPVNGTVPAFPYSSDQVYKFALVAGQTVNISMTGSGSYDMDIFLFHPETPYLPEYLDDPAYCVAKSMNFGNTESFTYTAPLPGTFYLDVCNWDPTSAGTFILTHNAVPPANAPKITSISPNSAPAAPGSKVTITGTKFGATAGTNGTVSFTYNKPAGKMMATPKIESWSDTKIVCYVPWYVVDNYSAAAGSGPVIVQTSAGVQSLPWTTFQVPFGNWGTHWDKLSVPYRFNGSSTQLAAVQAAANAWNNAGSSFRFTYAGACTSTSPVVNGYNDVAFADLEEGVIAQASSSRDMISGTWPFHLHNKECDLTFNTDYQWGDGAANPAMMDITTIGVHEYGHWLNLTDLYCDNDKPKCMYGYGSEGEVKRNLTAGDKAGILFLYPAVAVSAPTGVVAAPLATSKVSLYWTKAASTSGVTGYRVERATASTGPWTTLASPTTNYYAASGLTANTTYYFRVRAIKGSSVSSPSAVVSAKTLTPATVLVQQDYTGLAYSGTWTNVANAAFSGGSVKRTTLASSKVTVPFRGTAVKWIGAKGPTYGKVNIAVDGVTAATGLNLYAATAAYKQTLFTKSGLADKAHTLTITATVAGKVVDVDAFSVTGIAPALNREEATGAYAGTWSTLSSASLSGSTSRGSASSAAAVTFSFRGTGVTWIGTRAVSRGKAKVYVDGTYLATVDEFGAATAYQSPIWSKTGLALGTHTLKIVPAAAKNAASTNAIVDIDAIAVR